MTMMTVVVDEDEMFARLNRLQAQDEAGARRWARQQEQKAQRQARRQARQQTRRSTCMKQRHVMTMRGITWDTRTGKIISR